MPTYPRPNLNAAAARLAAAFGLTVNYRENWDGRGSLSSVWFLKDANGETMREIRFSCAALRQNNLGWTGVAEVFDTAGARLQSVTGTLLVDSAEGMGGKRAGKLARARFCEWAERVANSISAQPA